MLGPFLVVKKDLNKAFTNSSVFKTKMMVIY